MPVVSEIVIFTDVHNEERCDTVMASKVAIVGFNGNVRKSLDHALELIGGINDLNQAKRTVVVKVGVFDHRTENHTSVEVADAIIQSFSKAPKIYMVESDNYRGRGLERLLIWKELFDERVVPFNLSDDTETKIVRIADEEMGFSQVLFKPNVFVSTHILRGFDKGSILKNLFGLVPYREKARFHKKLDTVLLDAYEAVGGIDLAILDGTYLYKGVGAMPHAGKDSTRYRVKMNTLLVGRDAIAVEAVGAVLAGLNPEKMLVIREAMKRGLGEGDLDEIEVVGCCFEDMKARFSSALITLKGKKE